MSLQSSVTTSLAQLLAPLSTALSDPDHLAAFLADVGVMATVTDTELAEIVDLVDLAGPVDELLALADDFAGGRLETDEFLEQALPLATDVIDQIAGLGSLSSAQLSELADPLDDPDTWAELSAAIPGYLLVNWLRVQHPLVCALLELGGAVTRTEPVDAEPVRFALDWSALGRLLADPASQLAETYRWGGDLDGPRLLARLGALARASGIEARIEPLGEAIARDHFDGGAPPDGQQLAVPIFSGGTPDGLAHLVLRVVVAPVPRSGRPDPDSVLVTPEVVGGVDATLDLGGGWSATLGGTASPAGILGVVVSPVGTEPARSAAGGGSSIRLATTATEPWYLLGDGRGTGLRVESLYLEFTTTQAAGDADVAVEVGTDDAVLAIDPGEGDSFLAEVLGALALEVRLGVSIAWSASSGLRLGGHAGFEIEVPLDRSVGPLVVDSVRLALTGGESGSGVEVAATGSLLIGPFIAVLEDIGLRAELLPRASGGTFGAADLALGFKPPTGLGIGLDLEGILTGGGFLSLEPEIGRYAGVAQFEMLGVGLTAVGIVQTQLPDDPDGWSLFLSVMADFTPIPLGFGFTLNGVGGFMGLHRALDADALGLGVREGRIDSLLFPTDPLANAMQILADVEEFFPSRSGSHSFGAMVKIGWGAPTLITVEIGVILSVPEVIIAVVGELSCVLPDPDAALLELHMGVVGIIDVAGAAVSITASIYDSQLVGMALSGDMAMYLSVGAAPYFLLSVGGYAPGWRPPPSLPSSMSGLNRMAAAIDFGPTLDVGLDAYFAVTPNTLQFGSEVYAAARVRELGVDFTAEGSFGFDVQITFSPFQMEADMRAGVSIRAESFTLLSVQLRLHLEGPKPWYGSGTAEFTFLGQRVPFHVEVGGPTRDEAAPEIDLWREVLLPALSDPESWQIGPNAPVDAAVATGLELISSGDVTLRAVDPMLEPGLWSGPDARVEVRQRVVPFDYDIEVYGALAPDDGAVSFEIVEAGVADAVPGPFETIQDWFAPAQYTAMTSAERLSAPSYELLDAGVSVAATGFTLPTRPDDLTELLLGHEQSVVDSPADVAGTGALPVTFVRLEAATMAGMATASAAWSSRTAATASRYTVASEVPAGALRVGTTRYRLVDPLDVRAAPGGVGAGVAYAGLAHRRAVVPAAGGRQRVVPVAAARVALPPIDIDIDLPGDDLGDHGPLDGLPGGGGGRP